MLRTILNAAIVPLECLSVGLTVAERTSSASCWLFAATIATAGPTALHWARRLFGDADAEESPPPIYS